MDSQQHCEFHFQGVAPPPADVPWRATALPVPRHPQSAPSSYRPVPGQPRGHAGQVRDAMLPPANVTGNYQPDEDREDMPPHVENIAAQGRPQDLRYVDMGYYGMANDYPPLHEHQDHDINNYGGVALDVPSQTQGAPPAPDIGVFEGPAPDAAAGPARAFLDGRPHQGSVPNGLANEVLRQLAIVYLREPNSQVAMIRMEPGPSHAHGVRVVITLELVDL